MGWTHECVCGHVYDGLSWRELQKIGDPAHCTLGEVELEYRACKCGNTIVRVSDRTVLAVRAVLSAMPTDLRKFVRDTFDDDLAYHWARLGLGPDSVRAWLQARCFDPTMASTLEVMHITPDVAKLEVMVDTRTGHYVDTLGFAFARGDLSPVEALALVLPYSNPIERHA